MKAILAFVFLFLTGSPAVLGAVPAKLRQQVQQHLLEHTPEGKALLARLAAQLGLSGPGTEAAVIEFLQKDPSPEAAQIRTRIDGLANDIYNTRAEIVGTQDSDAPFSEIEKVQMGQGARFNLGLKSGTSVEFESPVFSYDEIHVPTGLPPAVHEEATGLADALGKVYTFKAGTTPPVDALKESLARAKKLLEARNQPYAEILTPDGSPAIQILPQKGAKGLGSLANGLAENLGVPLVFSPVTGFLLSAHAGFDSRSMALMVSGKALIENRISEMEMHELVHAFVQRNARKGGDSLFLASFARGFSEQPKSSIPYLSQLGFEELATWALQSRLYASLLRDAQSPEQRDAVLRNLQDALPTARTAAAYGQIALSSLHNAMLSGRANVSVQGHVDEHGKTHSFEAKITVPGQTAADAPYIFSFSILNPQVIAIVTGQAPVNPTGPPITPAQAIQRELGRKIQALLGMSTKLGESYAKVNELLGAGVHDEAWEKSLFSALEKPRLITLPYIALPNTKTPKASNPQPVSETSKCLLERLVSKAKTREK